MLKLGIFQEVRQDCNKSDDEVDAVCDVVLGFHEVGCSRYPDQGWHYRARQWSLLFPRLDYSLGL